MTVSDNTFILLFSFSLSHVTFFSQLKLLQLSNLTVSPSECPADKEKMEKTHWTPRTYVLPSSNIVFLLITYTIPSREIFQYVWMSEGCSRGHLASTSARSPYSECLTYSRTRLRNWINQLFWLGFGGWQSYYKKLQTSQEVDDVYRFISALGHIKWLEYTQQIHATAAQGGFCRHKHVCVRKERDRRKIAMLEEVV